MYELWRVWPSIVNNIPATQFSRWFFRRLLFRWQENRGVVSRLLGVRALKVDIVEDEKPASFCSTRSFMVQQTIGSSRHSMTTLGLLVTRPFCDDMSIESNRSVGCGSRKVVEKAVATVRSLALIVSSSPLADTFKCVSQRLCSVFVGFNRADCVTLNALLATRRWF